MIILFFLLRIVITDECCDLKNLERNKIKKRKKETEIKTEIKIEIKIEIKMAAAPWREWSEQPEAFRDCVAALIGAGWTDNGRCL